MNHPQFSHHRWLRSGHAQTIAGWAWPRRALLPPAEDRRFIVAPGVQVLCRIHWNEGAAPHSRLTLLLVHGLEGSSESGYIHGTAAQALAAGMNVVRMNLRTCGGTEHLSSTMYHSGLSEDLATVAARLAEDERTGQIAIAGFSLGGNQALKLAGEWGDAFPPYVCAVAAISPAMDLAASCDLLHAPSNRIYEWRFLRSLKKRAAARLSADRLTAIGAIGSMREFDDQVTAPAFGFAGAADYYARASASPLLSRIRVPTLVIYSVDDPFICLLDSTRRDLQANPNITTVECRHGGHCGFVGPRGRRWAEERVVEFASQRY
ncbi:MAG: alpha/beta fold hydrolase [Acidobacteria bacterium]|nr:alpha/beta fold hydrolase [Acidobacteriota bacterium]